MGAVYTATMAQNVTLDGLGRVGLWIGDSPDNYLQKLLRLTVTMDDAGDSNEKRYLISLMHTAAAPTGTSVVPTPHSTGASAYPAGAIRKDGNYYFAAKATNVAFSSLTGWLWQPTTPEQFIWGGSPSKHLAITLTGGSDSEVRYIESSLTFEVFGG